MLISGFLRGGSRRPRKLTATQAKRKSLYGMAILVSLIIAYPALGLILAGAAIISIGCTVGPWARWIATGSFRTP